MRRHERILRVYSEADWFAHLLLSTFIVAAINFIDILSQTIADLQAAGTRVVDGYEITICYFGPPPSFHPRLFVLLALLIATPAAFNRTTFSRFISSVGSAAALGIYILWWIASYRMLRDFEDRVGIQALIHPEVKQFACLCDGSPIDLAVVLSTGVCLMLMLDRLLDGEKRREGELPFNSDETFSYRRRSVRV